MKKVLLLVTIIILFTNAYAQLSSVDSAKLAVFRSIDSIINPAPKKDGACVIYIRDTSKETGYLFNDNGHFVYSPRTISFCQWVLVFLPVILFGFVLLYTLKRLKTENYSLSEMLSDNEPSEIDVDNPLVKNAAGAAVPGQPAFIKKSVLVRSTSRMAAFISSLCAVAIGTCSTSYYFYMYLKTGQAPNLETLYNILLGLGIGVVPYAVNKIAAAFK